MLVAKYFPGFSRSRVAERLPPRRRLPLKKDPLQISVGKCRTLLPKLGTRLVRAALRFAGLASGGQSGLSGVSTRPFPGAGRGDLSHAIQRLARSPDLIQPQHGINQSFQPNSKTSSCSVTKSSRKHSNAIPTDLDELRMLAPTPPTPACPACSPAVLRLCCAARRFM